MNLLWPAGNWFWPRLGPLTHERERGSNTDGAFPVCVCVWTTRPLFKPSLFQTLIVTKRQPANVCSAVQRALFKSEGAGPI